MAARSFQNAKAATIGTRDDFLSCTASRAVNCSAKILHFLESESSVHRSLTNNSELTMTLEISPTSWLHNFKAKHIASDEAAFEATSTETRRAVSDVADALNAVAVLLCLSDLAMRAVSAAVGYASGKSSWMIAPDAKIGRRLTGDADVGERALAARWKRAHEELERQQLLIGITFVEREHGGRDPKTKQEMASRIRVPAVDILAQVVEYARRDIGYKCNRTTNFERSALRVIDELPKDEMWRTPSLYKKPRRDDGSIIKQARKLCMTVITKTLKRIAGNNGDAREFAQELVNDILATADSLDTQPYKECTQNHRGGDDTLPCSSVEDVPVDANDLENFPLDEVAFLKEVEQGAVEACTAIEAAASVGASRFVVTMKDEPTGKATSEKVSLAEWVAKLPDYMEANMSGRESFIVRPEDASLIQVDDCTASEQELLAPVSFLVAETSEGNYQSWLALPPETSDEDRKRIRERLFKGALLDTPANVGAGNAMRWVGSLNCKPERRRADGSQPRVRLVAASFGRLTNEAELESYGLLAPHIPPCDSFLPVKPTKALDKTVPRTPPSYERCLQSVKLKENGKPDRSDADLLFCVTCFDWKFSFDETVALLKTISAKAKERRDHYAERTARFALSKCPVTFA